MSNKETLHIYVRCSTDKQIENSIKRQSELGIKLSKELNMDYKIWSDGGKSGIKSMTTRNQWMELMWEVELGSVKHLWVEDYTRITRNFEDGVMIDKMITENNLNVYEGLQGNSLYRPDELSQRLIKVVTSLVGTNQKKDEIKKSIQGKVRKIEQGFHCRGNTSFGYIKVDGHFKRCKEESKWVKKIFEWYRDGYSIVQLMKELKTNGVKTKKGNDFSDNGLYKILTNKDYIGQYIYTDRTKDLHYKDPIKYPYEDPSKHIIYTIDCPRLITDDLFYKVQKRLTTTKQHQSKHNYLLKSKIVCDCGCEWSGRKQNVGNYSYGYYQCSNSIKRYDRNRIGRKNLYKKDICNKPPRIKEQKLDDWVWNNIINTLEQSSFIKEKVKQSVLGTKYETSSSRRRINSDLKELNKELRSLKKNRVELIKEKVTLQLSENEFNEINSSVLNRINEVESELIKVKERELLLDKRSEWIDWIDFHKRDIHEYSKIKETKHKRRVIDTFVDHIEISYDEETKQHDIKIHYIYPLVNDSIEYVKNKDSKVKWNRWGVGYKVKKGDNNVSLSDQKKFTSVIVQNDDHSSTIKNEGDNDLVVSIHSTVTECMKTTKRYFISFIYRHKSSDFISKKVLDTQHQKLHNLIWKLKSEGLGYRRISKYLNDKNIRSHTNKEFYPSLVSMLYSKMKKKRYYESIKSISEYRDFDIGVYR